MTLTPTRSVDATRRIFEGGVWYGGDPSLDLPLTAARSAFDRGALGAAAMLCGIADRVIELGATYAQERHQFGKPIGSFQAVKHLLADALLGLEFARPLVYRAAWSVATGDEQRSRHVSMAKSYASDAAMNASRASLQVHGAIGYTHEHDLHLWLNKATVLAHAWGTAAWHRERIAL
jgi:alkylation response protein AidB-like acyl-CoA dehydrogenase